MSYTPTDIQVKSTGLGWTVSFILTYHHEIRYNTSLGDYRLYADGMEIEHIGADCRFKVEGVDCFFTLGILGYRLEIGGVKVKLMKSLFS